MRRALVAFIVLAVATPVLAWNNTGHFVVARLAWEQLDARERQAILALLKNHPHWERYFVATTKPAGAADGDYRIALGSTWADWLRGFAKAADDEGKKIYRFHVGPRHYINWPYVMPRDQAMFPGPFDIPEKQENIVVGLTKAMDELRGGEQFSPMHRAVALSWLLHLAGDIHQPLHNIALISKYSPKGDQGGNLFWVKDRGQPVRLHAYWDDVLGRQESYTAYVASYDQATAVVARLSRPEYGRERFAKELASKSFEEWSKEGFALGVEAGYRAGKLKGWITGVGKETEAQKQKAYEVPTDYHEAALAVASRQAALAGHRLADLLHEVAKRESERSAR